MKSHYIKLISFAVFILLVANSSSKVYTEEEYKVLQEKATFDILPYETYFEIFKDKNIGLGKNVKELYHKNKVAHEEYLQNMSKDFLPDIDIDFEPKSFAPTVFARTWSLKTYYPECFTLPIKDQGSCSSSYSFSSTFALAKRYCYDRKSRYSKLNLSPQDMISCNTSNDKCKGGDLFDSYYFLENYGVSEEDCTPYSSFIDASKVEHYPKCGSFCSDYHHSYVKYKVKDNSIKYIDNSDGNNIENIKREIYLHGPVSTIMIAFNDLAAYHGGIYTTTEKDFSKAESHAVTIVGWGMNNRFVEYWVVANSWGPNWGENGYFNIPFGHCEIASSVISGLPNH